jgi:hypothetical protein
MRKIKIPATVIVALLTTMAYPAWSQDLAGVRKALESKYAVTVTTADKTDIVTAGSVLVLKKSNLIMAATTGSNLYQNKYQNGRIDQNALGRSTRWMKSLPGSTVGASDRVFVTGEKIWLTGIEVKDKGVVFTLFTDAINDVRYAATLNFLFPKGSTPSVNDVTAMVGEVFDIQPSDDAKGQQAQQGQPAPANGAQQTASAPRPPPQQAAAAPQSTSTETAPPPIAPPPPPPADPKTISLGQTPDQVTANFGQPDKIIKLGAKQIFAYKDMKVTFVNGKVTDVQ